MGLSDEQTRTKPSKKAICRKRWDLVAAGCIAAGSMGALILYGDLRLAAFIGVLLLVAVVLIGCPRPLGQGVPRWVDRPTPPVEVYVSGWLVLLGIAVAVATYVFYHPGP